mgnify:CR=1 FL=1
MQFVLRNRAIHPLGDQETNGCVLLVRRSIVAQQEAILRPCLSNQSDIFIPLAYP